MMILGILISYFRMQRVPVSEELAEALRGQIEKNLFIKLYAEGFGGGVLTTIGEGTVAEWKRFTQIGARQIRSCQKSSTFDSLNL